MRRNDQVEKDVGGASPTPPTTTEAIGRHVKVLWSSASKRKLSPSTTSETVKVPPVFYPFEMLFEDGEDDDLESDHVTTTNEAKRQRKLDFSTPHSTKAESASASSQGVTSAVAQLSSSIQEPSNSSKKKKQKVSPKWSVKGKAAIRELIDELSEEAEQTPQLSIQATPVTTSQATTSFNDNNNQKTPSGSIGVGNVLFGMKTSTANANSVSKLSPWLLTGGPPDFRASPTITSALSSGGKPTDGAQSLLGKRTSAMTDVVREEMKLMQSLRTETDNSKQFEERLRRLLDKNDR